MKRGGALGSFLKCSVKECEKQAKFYPEVRFGSIEDKGNITQYPWQTMELKLCKDHGKSMTLERLFTPEGWTGVCDGFKQAKKPTPDWEFTRMRLARI